MLKGIDVSYANGTIDWSKAKKSIDFAIIRSTFGSDLPSQTDSFFTMNADGCVKYNIPFGTYHFAYFVDKKTAEDQANFAIRKANLYKKYVKFIALDIEEDSVQYAKRVGKYPNWTECALVFLKKIQSAGYTPVLYSNYSWITTVFDYEKLKQYKLWYAAPDASAPKFNPTIWQYSWKGKVNGLNGDVDMDYLYDEALIKNKKSSSTKVATISSDKEKFLTKARSYIGVNGNYVCNTKLGLGMVVDWCAYSISAIMKDCGFIKKYQGNIYGYASDAARQDNGKYGTWFLKGKKAPQPGDYIMFRYASFTNPIDKYSASHVGIVEEVRGNTIITLEGNVDGNNSNWAATSTFKRKTRYLNNSDVYAFYRPNWKTSTVSVPTPVTEKIDVTYQVYANNKWLPNVKNTEDYAGIENKTIQGVYMKPSKGHLRYRVKLIGNQNYLPWVIDRNDYAGILNKNIDCIQIELTDCPGYEVEYRVSNLSTTNYLPWVKGYNNSNDNGYAGIKNKPIDKLQIRIVKK